MSIAKKGLRKIIVTDEVFYWKIRKKISHIERHNVEYDIPVQHESEGQILLINIGFCRSEYYGRKPMQVTPSDIESSITEAIELGWEYRKPGKAIKLMDGELFYW
ncbi:hypothetical protein [Chryseobacterium jejuense]|uniref:Uncharacterized protein n=1 Tax=Chryseobacterium jejuense TaxID=445960 RepID=A0A2X2WR62_CHRJE|nr:hypothetical protein [Chryseobacterium jejuense]SDJ91575.1 hypothetical protein SAMN05421542_4659 [Chryseobacterium jejuense]SQB42964.1 Uncharacterised protein [Chryseobacterium jejuense]